MSRRGTSSIGMILHKTASMAYWYVRHHWLFRSQLMDDYLIKSVRPYRRLSWHLGARYYECMDDGGRRVFVKVSTHRTMIVNEVEARQALRPTSSGSVITPDLRFFDLDNPRPFIALSWVNGRTLGEVLVTSPRDIADTIATELVRLVDELHEAGVVHRDITPQNLLIAEGVGAVGAPPLLIDFAFAAVGDARRRDAELAIPERAFHTLGDGLNPAPLAWDDAFACLKILEKIEGATGREYPGARSELQARVGRRTYRKNHGMWAAAIS